MLKMVDVLVLDASSGEHDLILARRQLLQLPYARVHPFDDGGGPEFLGQRPGHRFAHRVQVHGLGRTCRAHQIRVAVGDQSRQQIGFAEDKAVSVTVANHLAAKGQSVKNALANQRQQLAGRNALASQQANRNLRGAAIKAGAERFAPPVGYREQRAGRGVLHLLQVGVVNPDMTSAEAGGGPRGNNGLRNGIRVLQCFIPGVQMVRSGSVLAARVTAPSKPKKKTALAPVWRAEGASLLLGGAAQFAAFG